MRAYLDSSQPRRPG